jgi:CubicO group peptidase (beta-lactamase class C family)
VISSEPARTTSRRTSPGPSRPLWLFGARQTLQRHHGRTTRYGRRRALLVAVLALLAVTASAASQHPLDQGRSSILHEKGRTSVLDDRHRPYRSTEGWPLVGQGAYVIGNGRPAVSPHQHPVPIASVAKVMTAYLVLMH